LGLVDPPQEVSLYILEAILAAFVAAWFTEVRDLRKRVENLGERISTIEGYLKRKNRGPT